MKRKKKKTRILRNRKKRRKKREVLRNKNRVRSSRAISKKDQKRKIKRIEILHVLLKYYHIIY